MIKPKAKPSFDRLKYTIQTELSSVVDEWSQVDLLNQLSDLVESNEDAHEKDLFIQTLYNKPYKLFIWKDGELIFWNHYKDLSYQNINQHKSDFHYINKEIVSNPYRVEILYPVIGVESHVVNRDLLRKSGAFYDFINTVRPSEFLLYLNNKEPAFYLRPVISRSTKTGYIVLFFLIGFSLLFFLIHYSSVFIARGRSSNKLLTIGVYLLGLFSIKLALSFMIPDTLGDDFILFSASNSFAFYSSIADFVLTSQFIFIGIISLNKILANDIRSLKKSKRYWLILFCWSIIIGFLLIISAGRGMVLDTDMHFNVEEIYNIDKYSLLSIISVMLMLFSLFNYSTLYSKYVARFKLKGGEKLIVVLLSFLFSLPVFLFLDLNISIYIAYGFLVIYFLLLDLYADSSHINIVWLIFWMVLFSGFTSVVFYNYSLKQEIRQRKDLVLSLYATPANEDLAKLSKIKEIIDGDELLSMINDNINSPIKLRQFDLIQYVNEKLDIEQLLTIESFDSSGSSLFSQHFLDEDRFLNSYILIDTILPAIYFDHITQEYILKYDHLDSLGSSGSTYITFRFSDVDAIDMVNTAFKNNRKASLFISREGKDLLRLGKYEPHDLNKEKYTEVISQVMGNGQLDIRYYPKFPDLDIRISSFKKIANIIKPISFFSYIFTLVGILILLALLLNFRYNFLSVNVNFDIRHSLRLKIQFTLLMMIVISFVLVGVLTSYYFQNLIKKDQLVDIRNKTTVLTNDIYSSFRKTEGDIIQQLKLEIPDLSYIHNTDLVLFSIDGRMLNTSDMDYNGSLLSYPRWFDFKLRNKNVKPVHRLLNGNIWESYIPLYDGDNYLGVLNIKHPKLNVLNNSILEFFSTLLNVYVFLFLLAGLIAIIISNSITRPLKLLANKIVDLKLGKQNETIEWKGSDEIGILINSYNEMLIKIDNSAQLLAKTQRDQAWREMAKQVAHEIKNPLTPMKLSMQYLEKMVVSNPQRAMELIPRISKTLIEQIDNLTGIANAFSNFAKMPKATNQRVLLNDVVETTHDLFRERDDIDIKLIEPIDDLYVFADKNHLVRILNNLLKNAMQAIPDEKRGYIVIELYKKHDLALIKVTDNGIGISDDMLDKVFTPNFTTKSSGTGLGLPIVANMIETFNGKIYFETEFGVGTSFYVEIPLMKGQNSEKPQTRVSLD